MELPSAIVAVALSSAVFASGPGEGEDPDPPDLETRISLLENGVQQARVAIENVEQRQAIADRAVERIDRTMDALDGRLRGVIPSIAEIEDSVETIRDSLHSQDNDHWWTVLDYVIIGLAGLVGGGLGGSFIAKARLDQTKRGLANNQTPINPPKGDSPMARIAEDQSDENTGSHPLGFEITEKNVQLEDQEGTYRVVIHGRSNRRRAIAVSNARFNSRRGAEAFIKNIMENAADAEIWPDDKPPPRS